MRKLIIRTKFFLITLASALVLSGIAAGCGGGGASGRAADKSFTLYAANVSTSLPSTYMPWLSNQGLSTTISSAVYSTLFTYEEDTGTYEPNLAETWEYVVEPVRVPEEQDYLEVKVTVNRDARWSDGNPVTAQDVYFTFDLASDFGRTNHAGALAWTGDLMHNYERNASGDWELVRQGIFTQNYPGPYTFGENEDTVVYFHVRKVLGGITPLFTTILVLPEHQWKIISPKNKLNSSNPIPPVEKLFKIPVGSGPYTLNTEESNNNIIVLNKRDDFHLKDENGDDLYKPETIKFINYLDMNVAISALKKGDVDTINSSIDAAYVENLRNNENLNVMFSEGRYLTSLVLNVNPPENYRTETRALLADPELRRAIALAMDQEELIEQVLKGRGTPVPPGLINQSSLLYNNKVELREPDPERAAEILDAAGYTLPRGQKYRSKDGVKLSFSISGNQAYKNLINYIKVQLEKIGIEIFFEEGGSNAVKDKYYTGDFDMTIQGVIFDITNIDMMMRAHFVTRGSSSNYGQLEHPELTEKVEEMRTTLNDDRKIELVKEIQEVIAGINYKIPLYCADVISVHRTDIYEGWTAVKGATVYNEETLSNLKFKED